MKVLVTEKYTIHSDAIKLLQERGHEVVFSNTTDIIKEPRLAEYDWFVIRSYTKITRKVLEKAENLQAIATCTSGIDHIDVDACKEFDIKVFSSPGVNANAVAEHAIALILTVLRRLPALDKSVREGKWERNVLAYELAGKTLGLIGIGSIGSLVAKKATALGMTVLAYDPYLSEGEVREAGARRVETVEEILKLSDVVSVHVPLTAETRGFIGEKELGTMKPTAIIINTSRGGVVKEDALVKALEARKIYGAGLDVFEKEPPAGSRLLALDNVVLSPHVGTMTEKAFRDTCVHAVNQMLSQMSS